MRIEPINFKDFETQAAVRSPNSIKSFQANGKRKASATPVAPRIYSEEEVKAAEREAYKKGFLEGTQEGRKLQDNEQASNDRKLLEGFDKFLNSVAPLFKDYRATITHSKEAMPKAALSIAHKVAAASLKENAQVVITDTVTKCIELMLGEPKLVVTVHPSLAEAVKQKVTQLAAQNPTAKELIVNGDAGMPENDCRVEWKDGALARDTGKLWQEIARVVESMSASAAHEAHTQMNALQAELPANAATPPTTNGKKE